MKLLIKVFFCIIFINYSIFSLTNDPYSIKLPIQENIDQNKLIHHDYSFEKLQLITDSDTFNWKSSFDHKKGNISFSFGSPIKLSNEKIQDRNQIIELSENFLNTNKEKLNIDISEINFLSAIKANKLWYVTYNQVHKGIPVLHSKIWLRIFENGNLVAMGSDYHTNIEVDIKPMITTSEANIIAQKDFIGKYKTSIQGNDSKKLYLLPIERKDAYEYKLVYKKFVDINHPDKYYTSYIDAHSGETVWRYNTVYSANTKIKIKGSVHMENPLGGQEYKNFPHQYLNVNGSKLISDENGELQVDLTENLKIDMLMEGQWAKVTYTDSVFTGLSQTYSPGEDINILWNETNSESQIRDIYFHANKIREKVLEIDPDISILNTQIPFRIELESAFGSNAYYSPQEGIIAFTNVRDTMMRFANSASVLYHEFGHLINDKLYKSLIQVGMENKALHEGLADVQAGFTEDTPYLGKGVYAYDPEKSVRIMKNNLVYPDDLHRDPHYTGLIVAGALWDLKELTSLETAEKLFHFARYGTPDNISDGLAFYNYFIEILLADDTDGDLTNGTPHMDEILQAFSKHQIGPAFKMINSFKHTELTDTKNTEEPYIANFRLGSTNIFDVALQDIKLAYTIDYSNNVNYISAEEESVYFYKAEIPAQEKGTIVNYYFVATNPLTGSTINFYKDNKKSKFEFYVDINKLLIDDCKDTGNFGSHPIHEPARWVSREIEQNLFKDPTGTLIIMEPAMDNDEAVTNCFKTGEVPKIFFKKPIYLESRAFDLSEEKCAIFSFHYWTRNLVFDHNFIGEHSLNLELSSDNGQTWTKAFSISEDQDYWMSKDLILTDFIELSEQVKIRFSAINDDTSTKAVWLRALINDILLIGSDKIISDVFENKIAETVNISPNPCNDMVKISIFNASSEITDIEIHDFLGNKIKTFENRYMNSEQFNIYWDTKDNLGRIVENGVYYLSCRTGNKMLNYKIIVMK